MQREAGQEPVLRGAAAAAHTPLQPALDWLDDPPDMGAKRAPTSTPWTMRGCLVIRCALLGTAARYDLKLWIGFLRESATYPPA